MWGVIENKRKGRNNQKRGWRATSDTGVAHSDCGGFSVPACRRVPLPRMQARRTKTTKSQCATAPKHKKCWVREQEKERALTFFDSPTGRLEGQKKAKKQMRWKNADTQETEFRSTHTKQKKTSPPSSLRASPHWWTEEKNSEVVGSLFFFFPHWAEVDEIRRV